MREIDNNMKGVNFKGIPQKPLPEETQVPTPVETSQEKREINDLSKMPAAFLGKSQVASNSTEADMQFLMKNIDKVEKMNNYFDAYAQKYGYEQATQMLDEFIPFK